MRPVIYQLFVRHFSNYSQSMKEWGTREENGCGTFEGITEKALLGIRELGVTHVWLTGVLRHASQTGYSFAPACTAAVVKGIAGSPYAVTDYYDVDPDLSIVPEKRMDEFRALIARCRRAGLVPLMDFIPNHVSRAYMSQCKAFRVFGSEDNTGVFFDSHNSFFYLTADAPGGGPPLKLPHPGFHDEDRIGRVTGNNCIHWAPTACDWYETVKLNYGYDFTIGPEAAEALPGPDTPPHDVPSTWMHMDEILCFWQRMGIGGFRVDMAHMVPVAFWKWALKRARLRDPGSLFMAEAYHDHMRTTWDDPLPHLLEAGFDFVYDAPTFHLAHKIYEKGKWANDFDALCNNENPVFSQSVRYLENHDEPRMGSSLHWGGTGLRIAPAMTTLMFCLSPGAILIYNGQEVGEAADGPGGFGGDNGRTSIFDYTHLPTFSRWANKGKFDGGLLTDAEKELRNHFVNLGTLLQHPALVNGKWYGLNWFNKQNEDFGRISFEHTSGHWIYAYLRHDFETGKTVLIAVNLHPEWDFHHIRVIIPKGAFEWMNWPGQRADFHDLNSNSPLTQPYLLDELSDRGFELSLPSGIGAVYEIIP